MLSQAVYWQRIVNQGSGGKDGWWFKTQREWNEEIGLTRYELETARTKIIKLKFMQTKKAGIPAKTWYRVDFQLLEEKLQQLQQIAENQQSSLPDTGSVVRHIPASKNVKKQHTIITETTPQINSETTTTTVAGVSEDELNILLDNVPESHRVKPSVVKLISDFSKQKGIKYVE